MDPPWKAHGKQTLRTVYALGDEPFGIAPPRGFEMKCPTCGEHTQDDWVPLLVDADPLEVRTVLDGPKAHNRAVEVRWMRCANSSCRELLIAIIEGYDAGPAAVHTNTYLVRPRGGNRPVDPLVQGQYRTDFEEAAAILNLSPRMSTVLSRRILADLLEDYAGLDDFRLVDRVDKFIADTNRPVELRENLHYLRELGDLSAHTKKNDQAEIVSADGIEAEWTLDVIERLFNYFIVGPARDKAIRGKIDQKLAETAMTFELINTLTTNTLASFASEDAARVALEEFRASDERFAASLTVVAFDDERS